MSFTATCFVCHASHEYPNEKLAQVAIVEHVYKLHREIYERNLCVNGRHGALCDKNHGPERVQVMT